MGVGEGAAPRTGGRRTVERCACDTLRDSLDSSFVIVDRGGQVHDALGSLGQALPAQAVAVVTAGDELVDVARLVPPGCDHYSAADVIRYMRNGHGETAAANGAQAAGCA